MNPSVRGRARRRQARGAASSRGPPQEPGTTKWSAPRPARRRARSARPEGADAGDTEESIVEVSGEQCGAAQGRSRRAPAEQVGGEACLEARAERATGGARRSITPSQPAEARMAYW